MSRRPMLAGGCAAAMGLAGSRPAAGRDAALATGFDAMGSPFRRCGVPQDSLETQRFVALNLGPYATGPTTGPRPALLPRNRAISWDYAPAPGYVGEVRFYFLKAAMEYWPLIMVTIIPHGISGVEQWLNGVCARLIVPAMDGVSSSNQPVPSAFA